MLQRNKEELLSSIEPSNWCSSPKLLQFLVTFRSATTGDLVKLQKFKAQKLDLA